MMGYLIAVAIMVIAIIAVVIWLRADLDQEMLGQDSSSNASQPPIDVPEAPLSAPGTLPETNEEHDQGGNDDGRSRTGIPEKTA